MADSISLLPESIQQWYKAQEVEIVCRKVKEVARSKLEGSDVYNNETPFSETAEVFDNQYFDYDEAGDVENSDYYFKTARLYSSLTCCEEGDVGGAVYELYFGLGESTENFLSAMNTV